MGKIINYINFFCALFTLFNFFISNAESSDLKKFQQVYINNLLITGECVNIINSDNINDNFRFQADQITISADKTSLILEGHVVVNYKNQVITGNKLMISNLNPNTIQYFSKM